MRRNSALLKPLCLLTMKPVMYVANVGEKGFTNNPLLDPQWRSMPRAKARRSWRFAPRWKSEIAELSDEEKREFLADIGMNEPGLNRLIRAAYQLLGLQTYFTAGRERSARLDDSYRRYRPAGGGRDSW